MWNTARYGSIGNGGVQSYGNGKKGGVISKWQNRIGQSAVPEGKAGYGKVQYGIVGYCTYSKVQCRLVAGWWSVGGRLGGDWLDVGWGSADGR